MQRGVASRHFFFGFGKNASFMEFRRSVVESQDQVVVEQKKKKRKEGRTGKGELVTSYI